MNPTKVHDAYVCFFGFGVNPSINLHKCFIFSLFNFEA